MIVRKWNARKEIYEPFEIPSGAKLFSEDMDEVIECASCGKEMTYGQGYTSRQIHTHIGLGFPVCGECYQRECEVE